MAPQSTTQTESDTSVLDDMVCFDLYATSRSVTAVYRRALAPHSLTYPQFLILKVLWARHTQTASQLVEQLHLDHATLTPVLQRMDRASLVVREPDPADARVTLVSLGPRGEELRSLAPGLYQQIGDAMGLSRAEAQHLQRLLRSVRTAAQTVTSA